AADIPRHEMGLKCADNLRFTFAQIITEKPELRHKSWMVDRRIIFYRFKPVPQTDAVFCQSFPIEQGARIGFAIRCDVLMRKNMMRWYFIILVPENPF